MRNYKEDYYDDDELFGDDSEDYEHEFYEEEDFFLDEDDLEDNFLCENDMNCPYGYGNCGDCEYEGECSMCEHDGNDSYCHTCMYKDSCY